MRGWSRAFKECDIRGPYPSQVDEELAYRLGLAMASEVRCRAYRRVVVAGDVRVSTPALQARLLDGLRDGGAQALDCGLLPTPGYYFARRRLGVEAGVMVTASHSPADCNGFKPILGPLPITPEDLRKLEGLVVNPRGPAPGGSVEHLRMQDEYQQWLIEAGQTHLSPAALALRAVVDCGNGSFAPFAPAVFSGLGIRCEPLFCDADGRFPNRSPDVAVAGALDALGRAVPSPTRGERWSPPMSSCPSWPATPSNALAPPRWSWTSNSPMRRTKSSWPPEAAPSGRDPDTPS